MNSSQNLCPTPRSGWSWDQIGLDVSKLNKLCAMAAFRLSNQKLVISLAPSFWQIRVDEF